VWKLLVKEQIVSLLDSRLFCWLLVRVNGKCARLGCMRVPFLKGKQQYQILVEEYDIRHQNYGEVKDQPACSVV